MYTTFNKIFSVLLTSSMISLSGCNSTSKNLALNNTDVKALKVLKQDIKTKDDLEKLPNEKNILLTTNIKKNLKEQENNSYKLEMVNELNILDEHLIPICWSDEENIIAIKHIGGLKHSYDVYNINISNSETTKITRIDYVIPKSNATAVTTKKLLFLNNFKLCTYNLKENTINEVYDLSKIKKDLEDDYSNHYLEKGYLAPESYSYTITEKQKESDDKFVIKDDLELIFLFDISPVQGSDNYISIISSRSKNGQIIRMLDIDSKIVISSKRFNDLNLSSPEQTGFKYNKKNNAFYICGNLSNENTQTIYEYTLDNPNYLREIKNISYIRTSTPIQCPDNENFYFIGDSFYGQNSIMRYNTTNNKLSVIFKDKPEGYYSSLKFINNTNLICFNYKKDSLENKSEEFSFIGLLQEDTIKNIQKLSFKDLYPNGQRIDSIILNENGNSQIFKTYDHNDQSSIGYANPKFFIYKIHNIKTVLRKENSIIYTAKQFLGTPYLWGGNTPEKGFDTSGFVQYVYKQNGIKLGRTTYPQIDQGIHVPKDNLKTGDLVFFGTNKDPHHVGIYIGNNHFIHAPRTGDIVKISPMSSRKDYLTARRILE